HRGGQALRDRLPRGQPARHDGAAPAREGPGVDGPPAHQGVELDARHLPPRGVLPGRLLARRRVEGDAGRPVAPAAGRHPPRPNRLTDMANGGDRKSLPGELNVFNTAPTHELSAHRNVNSVRLDRLPRFDEGWQPVLDALRAGRFFVTTGEVLLRDFTVGGKGSGETLSATDGRPEVRVDLEWTFPLRFAEVISGDGTRVYSERVDLAETGPFGRRTLTLSPDLRGRKWARVEAWDVAGNGAFSQPVWLESAAKASGEVR